MAVRVGVGDGDAIGDGVELGLGLAATTTSLDGDVRDVFSMDDCATGCGADELPPLMPAAITATDQTPQTIAFVRTDHFVRTTKITTVIGKNRMPAAMTSHRGNPLERLGVADGVASDSFRCACGWSGAWLAGTHSEPVHHHCRSSENRDSTPKLVPRLPTKD